MKKNKSPSHGIKVTKDEQGNSSIEFSTGAIEVLTEKGAIPKKFLNDHLERGKRLAERCSKIKDFREKFPDAGEEAVMNHVFGLPKTLTQDEVEAFKREWKASSDMYDLLLKIGSEAAIADVSEEAKPLFKNIDADKEFGIVRLVADQMSHLPELLETARVEQTSKSEYSIISSKKLGEKTLSFSHPITAQDQTSAEEIAETIKGKLLGLHSKMWQACWFYANKANSTQFSAPIIELMKVCYPTRDPRSFSAKEKESFYEELRRLRLGEFTLSWEQKRPRSNKLTKYNYNIPMLKVGGSLGESDGTGGQMEKVLVDLCAITPPPAKEEKMRWVGAPIKKSTLGLYAPDGFLAFVLQVRKNQITTGEEPKTPDQYFDLLRLITAANLQATHASNPRMGKKRLSEKLERIVEIGAISKFQLLEGKVRVWW